jgi:hypothetical protein
MRDADHGARDLLEKSREIAKVTQEDRGCYGSIAADPGLQSHHKLATHHMNVAVKSLP